MEYLKKRNKWYPSLHPLLLFPQPLNPYFHFQVNKRRPFNWDKSLDTFIQPALIPENGKNQDGVGAVSKY